MKIEQTTKNAAVMSTASDTMGVDASKQEKLLFMLSDKLYANKFNSIIRELASNARDSHDDAGVSEPFVITAPTQEEPELSIEDFGTGLDYETAKKTILMFLGSTKDYDDVENGRMASQSIGGFGIGSKSPRAYTSDYQMVLRKDGMEYVVVISNNENGLPQSSLLVEAPTDKPNGVKVIVPVLAKDIDRWQGEVERYMEGTNYNCVADIEGEKIYPAKAVASIDFGEFHLDVFNNPNHRDTKPVYVSYGGVLYGMTHEESKYSNGLEYQLRNMLQSKFVYRIRVETSEKLDFSLSRETIENTDKSVAFLNSALKKLMEEAKKSLSFGDSKCHTRIVQVVDTYDGAAEKLAQQEEAYRNRMGTVLGAYAEVNFKSYKLDVGGFYLERRSHRLKRDASLALAIDTKPAVKVLWSNEPISDELLKELARLRGEQNEVTIKCSEKTLAKVKEWMSKKFPNLPYTDWYYEQAKRTVIRSAPQFTVCAATGNRIELKYAKYAVPSKEFMWVGAAMGKTVFVPSASTLKRGLPSHITLMTEKEILEESVQTLEWAESIATGEQAVEAVFQMVEYLQRNSDKLLDQKEFDRVREVLLSARKRAVRLHNRMREVRAMSVYVGTQVPQVLPPCAYREMEFSHEGSTLKLSDAIKMGNEVIRKIVTDGDKLVMLNTAEFVKRLAEGDKLAEKLAKLLKLA